MASIAAFKALALSFPEVTEEPHFHKTSYRVKKKIFATIDESTTIVTIKLTAIDQSVFCAFDSSIIFPVEGTWGKQGWTRIELKKIKKEMLSDALKTAYCGVAGKKLAALLDSTDDEK